MTNDAYLKKLSRIVYWRFSKKEAEGIISDYGEFLAEANACDEQLINKFGTPNRAISRLTDLKTYGLWLAAFSVMAACIGISASYMFLSEVNMPLVSCLFVLGLLIAVFWFFRKDEAPERKKALPKGLPAFMLTLLAAICAAVALFLIGLGTASVERCRLIRLAIRWIGFLSAVAGFLGLIGARLNDRRWRAVYVLGFTSAMLCLLVLSIVQSLTLDITAPLWWLPYLYRGIGIFIAGLIAAGVALC